MSIKTAVNYFQKANLNKKNVADDLDMLFQIYVSYTEQ